MIVNLMESWKLFCDCKDNGKIKAGDWIVITSKGPIEGAKIKVNSGEGECLDALKWERWGYSGNLRYITKGDVVKVRDVHTHAIQYETGEKINYETQNISLKHVRLFIKGG